MLEPGSRGKISLGVAGCLCKLPRCHPGEIWVRWSVPDAASVPRNAGESSLEGLSSGCSMQTLDSWPFLPSMDSFGGLQGIRGSGVHSDVDEEEPRRMKAAPRQCCHPQLAPARCLAPQHDAGKQFPHWLFVCFSHSCDQQPASHRCQETAECFPWANSTIGDLQGIAVTILGANKQVFLQLRRISASLGPAAGAQPREHPWWQRCLATRHLGIHLCLRQLSS